MFDVFHNVFGKKKPNSDQDRQSTGGNDADRSPSDNDFVIIGSTATDKTAVKDTDVNPNDAPPPFHMFDKLAVSDQLTRSAFTSIFGIQTIGLHLQRLYLATVVVLWIRIMNTLYPVLGGSSGITRKGEPDGVNIMSLQGVPFVLNATLNVPGALEQIWQRITPCLNSIVYPKSLETEYDFNVERSVVS